LQRFAKEHADVTIHKIEPDGRVVVDNRWHPMGEKNIAAVARLLTLKTKGGDDDDNEDIVFVSELVSEPGAPVKMALNADGTPVETEVVLTYHKDDEDQLGAVRLYLKRTSMLHHTYTFRQLVTQAFATGAATTRAGAGGVGRDGFRLAGKVGPATLAEIEARVQYLCRRGNAKSLFDGLTLVELREDRLTISGPALPVQQTYKTVLARIGTIEA
jgi:hypothetical protein